MAQINLDSANTAHFDTLAQDWWDPTGPLKTLHHVNPLRVEYISEQVALLGTRVLDIGCGAGLLSEAMAKAGAAVTGIDAAENVIDAAIAHAKTSKLSIDYQVSTVEDFDPSNAKEYDLVTCLELIEHVPDAPALLRAAAAKVRVGGLLVVSTLNRNPKSFLTAIVGAEYLLGLIPKGTHEYRQFIRPSELKRWGEAAGLHFYDLQGMHYNPFSEKAVLSDDVSVNYLMTFKKDAPC